MKAHLWKVSGMWLCGVNLPMRIGRGQTPAAAFEDFRRTNHLEPEYWHWPPP